jgi:hypothetical protein
LCTIPQIQPPHATIIYQFNAEFRSGFPDRIENGLGQLRDGTSAHPLLVPKPNTQLDGH